MTEPSIRVSKLSKQYPGSEKYALKNLNLEVMPGEIYGFLGPNGAGKSTTINLLMNYIQPTDGEAKVLGKDIVDDSVEIKKSAGFLSGDTAMYPKMSGAQFLSYMDELQPSEVGTKNISKLAKRLQADLNKRLQDLSRGNRQKIGIIQAFMHEPQILILDEPTSGLDPLMQDVFHDLLQESKQRGATIFMSSHILSEVQKMCDRVGIIRGGQLVSESKISDLVAEAAQTFDIVFANQTPLAELKKVRGVRVQRHDGNMVTIHMNGKLNSLFTVLAKHDVLKIDARTLDLEEMFMQFYGEGAPKQ